MNKFIAAFAAALLFAVMAMAQEKPAVLQLTTDADCTWKLDGKDQGALKKKDKTTVEVAEGEHLIEAASDDGIYLWVKKVKVSSSKKEEVKIGLVHDAPFVDKYGLMWAPKDNKRDVDYKTASEYCANLKIGPYGSWRLHSMYEMQRASAALNYRRQ